MSPMKDAAMVSEQKHLPPTSAFSAGVGRVLALMPKLSRYAIVSIAALVLDFTVYISLTQADVSPTLAGIVGYSFGLLLHYTLSVRFVFDQRASDKSMRRTFAEFVISGLLGLVLTALVIWIATTFLGLPALIAKGVAVVASFLAVFAMRHTIVFAPLS